LLRRTTVLSFTILTAQPASLLPALSLLPKSHPHLSPHGTLTPPSAPPQPTAHPPLLAPASSQLKNCYNLPAPPTAESGSFDWPTPGVAGWQAVFYTAADCPAGAIEVQGGASVKAGGWSITYDSLANVGADNCFGPIWTRNGGGGSVFIAPSGTTPPGGWPTETEKPVPSGSGIP